MSDRRVFKFELVVQDEQYVPIHPRDTVLLIAEQRGKLCLWAEVDFDRLEAEKPRRLLHIIGTGNRFPSVVRPLLVHLGSVLMSGGSLVWHIYEELAA